MAHGPARFFLQRALARGDLAPRFVELVAVVSFVADQSRRPPAAGDLSQRFFDERALGWRGTVDGHSERKTITVDNSHPLGALSPIWFWRQRTPSFRGGKAAVHETFSPVDLPAPVEVLEQFGPDSGHRPVSQPSLEPPMAGRLRWIPIR